MINSTLSLIYLFSVVFIGNVLAANLLYYLIPASIFLAIIAIYFIHDHTKKNFDFKQEKFLKEISDLQSHNEKLNEELIDLTKNLEIENAKWGNSEKEKQILIQEKEQLEETIQSLRKARQDEKDDIVIEYFLNDK